jgi:hypothetical protein
MLKYIDYDKNQKFYPNGALLPLIKEMEDTSQGYKLVTLLYHKSANVPGVLINKKIFHPLTGYTLPEETPIWLVKTNV